MSDTANRNVGRCDPSLNANVQCIGLTYLHFLTHDVGTSEVTRYTAGIDIHKSRGSTFGVKLFNIINYSKNSGVAQHKRNALSGDVAAATTECLTFIPNVGTSLVEKVLSNNSIARANTVLKFDIEAKWDTAGRSNGWGSVFSRPGHIMQPHIGAVPLAATPTVVMDRRPGFRIFRTEIYFLDRSAVRKVNTFTQKIATHEIVRHIQADQFNRLTGELITKLTISMRAVIVIAYNYCSVRLPDKE